MLKSLAVLLLAISWVGPGPGTDPGPPRTTAFVNVSVIPMDEERVLTGQTVLVRGGRIRAMGPTGQVPLPAGAQRIDGKGKFLIPGLADMHVHLEVGKDSFIGTHRLLRYLGLGITTVRNMGGSPAHLKLREAAAQGKILSPRIYTASPPINGGKWLPTPDSAKALVANYKAAGYDFIKLYVHLGGGVSREIFDTLVAATQRAGIPFAGHAPSPVAGLDDMLRSHAASIEHLTGYMRIALNIMDGQYVLGQHISEADIPALAGVTRRAGVWNCPTGGPMVEGGGPELTRLFTKMVKALSDSGAGLLLGTDDGFLEGHDVDQELQMFVKVGLTPYQALATGTRNVAQFFGTLDSTGTIAIGKKADLVLLNGNPLQNIGNVREPAGVMLHGKWLPREVLDSLIEATDPARIIDSLADVADSLALKRQLDSVGAAAQATRDSSARHSRQATSDSSVRHSRQAARHSSARRPKQPPR